MDAFFHILSDFSYILIWYLFIQILAFAVFPFVLRVIPLFEDKGWGFSKVFGVFVFSWLVWLLSSLHLLAFNRIYLLGLLFILVFCSFYFGNLYRQLLAFFKEKRTVVLIEELLFIAILIGWSIVRGYFPEIRGLEKFMDYGFVVSSFESTYAPPRDMWYSAGTINYYYFGHFMTAVLAKLTNIPSEIAYNLQIASIFALSVVASFSIVYNVTKKYLFGLLASVFVCFIGNLDYAVKLISKVENYWYPDATRLIPYTISEYPIYSFVVADLHGHLSSIPLVLAALGLIVYTVLYQRNWYTLGSLGVLLGGLYATNSWDYPIYLGLFGLALFVTSLWESENMLHDGVACFFDSLKVFVISIASFLPFFLNFKPISTSIGIGNVRSPLELLLIFWGFHLFFVIVYLVWFSLQRHVSKIEVFFTVVIFVCLLLIIFPEFFYVKDIYTVNYFRANTMFKLYYQAWIMLGVFGAWAAFKLVYALRAQRIILFVFLFTFITLTVATGSYGVLATKTYYQDFKKYQGLDGLSYLKTEAPFDLEAIKWMRSNIKKEDVIVEGVGDSYTNYARVSAYSGRATVLGWPVHEWLWRGSWPKVAERQGEVQKIYESQDMQETQGLLNKHQVRYVYIGNQERTKYASLYEDKFASLGSIAYENQQVRIYKIR